MSDRKDVIKIDQGATPSEALKRVNEKLGTDLKLGVKTMDSDATDFSQRLEARDHAVKMVYSDEMTPGVLNYIDFGVSHYVVDGVGEFISKPTSEEVDGKEIQEVHDYMFYGYKK